MSRFPDYFRDHRKSKVLTSAARNHSSTGQSLVEFVLTLPLLLLILVGIIDLGRMYNASVVIANAAREGARYGADHPAEMANIQSQAANAGADLGLSSGNVQISFPDGNSNPGNGIQVTVSHDFALITGYIFAGIQTIPIKSSATMQIK